MPLVSLKIKDFRCFEEAEFHPAASYNLVYGANASGKTSLLEAIAYLGRGKSMRAASTRDLVRHGASEFVLFGRASRGDIVHSIGVRNGRGGLETRIDGSADQGAAGLAETLPLLVIDPDIHELVDGAPEGRRRYLDWIGFHVEHGYLDQWRRFRRALKQRNSALRQGSARDVLRGWDQEFIEAGLNLHRARSDIAEIAEPLFAEKVSDLLGADGALEYRRGWSAGTELEDSLAANWERDREQGSTGSGPHRADVKLILDERQARKLVSRGQQKLLACSLALTALDLVQTHLERPLLLLLDDPAAELDKESLGRLMNGIGQQGCQVVATALEPLGDLLPGETRMFHVEHGVLQQR